MTTTHKPTKAPAIVGPWQYDSDEYGTQYAETSDPRILAVIQRDENADAPDGECYAPAFWIEYRDSYRVESAGATFQDDASEAIAERYADALERFAYRMTHVPSDSIPDYYVPKWTHDPTRLQRTDILARWLRIFHDTTAREVDRRAASYGVSGRLLILSTPSFREAMGRTDAGTDPAVIDGDAGDWSDYMAGDVFGVGWATMPARTTKETPVEFGAVTEGGDMWEVDIECWGHYGEAYARETAAGFEYGAPNLPAMLPGTAPEAVTL